MRDSTYKRVKEYLVQRGYPAVPDETYDHTDIALCMLNNHWKTNINNITH